MKKNRIVALVLVLAICMSFAGIAQARGTLELSCNMTSVGNGKYRVSGTVQSGFKENLTVYVYVYKVVGGTLQYVDGFYNTGYDTVVKTEKTLTLSSGTYEVHVEAEGNTSSGGASRAYRVS